MKRSKKSRNLMLGQASGQIQMSRMRITNQISIANRKRAAVKRAIVKTAKAPLKVRKKACILQYKSMKTKAMESQTFLPSFRLKIPKKAFQQEIDHQRSLSFKTRQIWNF